jgi:hypothetical protein
VRPVYKLLRGDIEVTNPQSFSNQADCDRNWLLCRELLFDDSPRLPWRDDSELNQFRGEVTRALSGT